MVGGTGGQQARRRGPGHRKRQISDAIFARLQADARQAAATASVKGPGGHTGNDSVASAAKPPRAAQAVMFGLLGPIGRLRGYRGIYPQYCDPHGHTTPDPAVLAIAGLAPPGNPHPDAGA